jgi:trehalose/maltose hydrolase-like predicted phosphorylase/beta-phosphoglucomutase-like phosphatase (HAD superfamily)
VTTPLAFRGAIFDVDGVLVDPPHARGWQEALRELMAGEWQHIRAQTSYAPERYTPAVYQQLQAGKQRLAGARAALEYFGLPDADRLAKRYATVKQEHVVRLIEEGQFTAFPDALRFILAVKGAGIPVAAAPSSQNAKLFLRQIRLDTFTAEQRLDYPFVTAGMTLLDLFDADTSGRDIARGKPSPLIFLTAAGELGATPSRCLVVENGATGIQAAKAGGMAVIGIARHGEEALLVRAGADLVVGSLDHVLMTALVGGRLEQTGFAAELTRRQQQGPRSAWTLAYEGFEPEHQGLREALCALGNGYFVTRGALPEADADGIHYPGTYVAGLYNRLQTAVADRIVEHEDLVNVPNWLPLSFRMPGGSWFDVRQDRVLEHRLELDLRRGILTRTVRWEDASGRRTRVVQRRLVSMQDPHLAALETEFTAENWSGPLEVSSGLNARVVNAGVRRYRDLNGRHLSVLHTAEADHDTIELQAETSQSHIRIALSARTRVSVNGRPVNPHRLLVIDPGFVAHQLTLNLEEQRPVRVEKIAALYTSRDRAISESLLSARLAANTAPGFGRLVKWHAAAWDTLWDRFDIEVNSANDWVDTVLHLHVFHLLQTLSPHSTVLDVGVPARGWHGEAYRGHVFWDEMFIFSFLNLQRPWLASALLDYRRERLGAARAAASAAGYDGAMFPWQSGSDGREEAQRWHLNPVSGRWLPDHSHLQRHVNIAVAYNVWQHYAITGSIQYLRFQGAELLIEIARLWASLATYNRQLDRYEILGILGPDEYHDAYPGSQTPGVNNNTYTNVMAVWVLLRALQALDELPPHYRNEIVAELGVGASELDRWRDITRKMRVVFTPDGILAQFEGYDQLKEFDFAGYRARYGNIRRLDRVLEAEGDTTNDYQVSKQADVLMLQYLLPGDELQDLLSGLGYHVTRQQLAQTVDYYLARTVDGSTLSGVVTSWVLARQNPAEAWRHLLAALNSDVADIQGGTTAEGIHLGAMAGTVDIVLRGLTGMLARGDTLRFDPALPEQVRQLRFSVHYRGNRLDIRLVSDRMSVTCRPGREAPVTVTVREQTRQVTPGETAEFQL